tara:strand:- start:5 stop:460 length:456 start_codon:yes stop_codon:yes gene_type:complete
VDSSGDDDDVYSQQRGEWEMALHCSYTVLEVIQRSLQAVNIARYKVGVSPLAINVSHLIRRFQRSYKFRDLSTGTASGPRVREQEREDGEGAGAITMGAYGKGDVEAMEMLQHRLGSTSVESFQWEPSGAVFVLQQQHLADSLRKQIDMCK